MIGTIYERLRAIVDAIVAEGIEARRVTIHAHPETMRELAVCFTPELSAAEITFDGTETIAGLELTESERNAIGLESVELIQRAAGMAPMRWRGSLVFEDRYLGKGAFLVKIDRARAVLVRLDRLPALDHMIPKALDAAETTAVAKRALERITPRATPEPEEAPT